MRDVKTMSEKQLRNELSDLRAAHQAACDDLEESGGAAGSPLEWFDERTDEIKTELKRRK